MKIYKVLAFKAFCHPKLHAFLLVGLGSSRILAGLFRIKQSFLLQYKPYNFEKIKECFAAGGWKLPGLRPQDEVERDLIVLDATMCEHQFESLWLESSSAAGVFSNVRCVCHLCACVVTDSCVESL